VDQWDVRGCEVGAKLSLGLRAGNQAGDRRQQLLARRSHSVLAAAHMDDEVLQAAVGGEALLELLEQIDQSVPGVGSGSCLAGESHEDADLLLEDLVQERVLVAVAAVDSADTKAGAACDIVERRLEPTLGKDLPSRGQDALAVALSVSAEPARPGRSGFSLSHTSSLAQAEDTSPSFCYDAAINGG